mmetsp:Transcript_9878/g.33490  ORF Transcript_9878/g.33490 Transcript_9878/m.33490 type:complete len:494 (-) Transcript_9878:186-1667(-)
MATRASASQLWLALCIAASSQALPPSRFGSAFSPHGIAARIRLVPGRPPVAVQDAERRAARKRARLLMQSPPIPAKTLFGKMFDPASAVIGAVVTAVTVKAVEMVWTWYFSERRRFASTVAGARISVAALKTNALPYVSRGEIDGQLQQLVGTRLVNPKINTLAFVFGPRGGGKSTSVAHALENTTGVVFAKVSGDPKCAEDIYRSIVNAAIGVPPNTAGPTVDEATMTRYLRAASAKYRKRHPDAVGWRPTIVLELETSSSAATVRLATQAMKGIVWDRGACGAILVLSDAHTMYSITSDSGRHTYIWVGDFTEEEADVYLDELGALSDDRSRSRRSDVYARSTTRAVGLSALASELKTAASAEAVVDRFVRDKALLAEARVTNLISVAMDAAKQRRGERGLHFIRLMRAMLVNGGTLAARDARDYLCTNQEIADVLKLLQHHAIVLNTVDDVFVFNTPADRLAAHALLGEAYDDDFDDGFGSMPALPRSAP